MASICAFATIVGVALVIAPLVGIVSIPIAYAIGSGVKVILLALFVTRRLASIDRADANPTAAEPA